MMRQPEVRELVQEELLPLLPVPDEWTVVPGREKKRTINLAPPSGPFRDYVNALGVSTPFAGLMGAGIGGGAGALAAFLRHLPVKPAAGIGALVGGGASVGLSELVKYLHEKKAFYALPDDAEEELINRISQDSTATIHQKAQVIETIQTMDKQTQQQLLQMLGGVVGAGVVGFLLKKLFNLGPVGTALSVMAGGALGMRLTKPKPSNEYDVFGRRRLVL